MMIILRIFIIATRETIQQLKIHLTSWDRLNSHQILILPKKLEILKDNLQYNLKKHQERGHHRYSEIIMLQNNLKPSLLIFLHSCSFYLSLLILTMQVWNLLLYRHKIFYLKRYNPSQNSFQRLWITATTHTQNVTKIHIAIRFLLFKSFYSWFCFNKSAYFWWFEEMFCDSVLV